MRDLTAEYADAEIGEVKLTSCDLLSILYLCRCINNNAAKGADAAVEKAVFALDLPQNYTEDKTYGKRFLVSKTTDKTEVEENTRAARALVA